MRAFKPRQIFDQSPLDSFALIRIDDDELPNVSPAVRGFGAPPTGHTTSDDTAIGDEIFLYGQAVGLNATEATRRRAGKLDQDDARSFWSTLSPLPVFSGDAGAPVVRTSDGKALGVMSYNGVPSSRGTTVERILRLLSDAGWQVSLVTSPTP